MLGTNVDHVCRGCDEPVGNGFDNLVGNSGEIHASFHNLQNWARELQKLGHTVKLMVPQFVKPYVKTNKNDANDAEALCEAVARPTMRFVAIKTIAQQYIQAVHRIRSELVQQ